MKKEMSLRVNTTLLLRTLLIAAHANIALRYSSSIKVWTNSMRIRSMRVSSIRKMELEHPTPTIRPTYLEAFSRITLEAAVGMSMLSYNSLQVLLKESSEARDRASLPRLGV